MKCGDFYLKVLVENEQDKFVKLVGHLMKTVTLSIHKFDMPPLSEINVEQNIYYYIWRSCRSVVGLGTREVFNWLWFVLVSNI